MYKVIIVDDDYMIIKGLTRLINWEKIGIELVGTCSNGQEAYEFVNQNHVDIVITDVSMPFMDGIEFIKQTQKENLNFYVVLMSGYQEFEYVKEGIQLGVENFIVKPVDKDILNKTLEDIVDKLNDEKIRLSSEQLIFEDTLNKWISNDIELTDLRRITKHSGRPLTSNSQYTVLIFSGEESEKLEEIFESFNQPFYFYRNEEIVLIFEGNMKEFSDFRNKIQFIMDLETAIRGVGELFVDILDVHRSFDAAINNKSFISFYKGHPISRLLQEQNETIVKNHIVELDFSKLHETIAIRDENLIFKEIHKIFAKLKKEKADPNYIRYISFVIISDIYREHGITDARLMNENVQRVYDSETLSGVETTLYRVYNEINETKEEVSYSEPIRKLLQLIMQRYQEDITLSMLADEIHVSSMYLGQLFKKELGVSFSQYLNTFRIKKAQELIVNTSLNFSEISLEVGYSSPGYFYKKFKKESNLSPSDYRTKYRKT